MNSHIQIPKCVFREFALNNHGFYKYSIKSQKVTRGYPKTTFTEENYYSETMEHILSNSVESPLNKLLTFSRELPNTSLPITYNAEIADIALTYAKSLVARNPLLCESAISHSLFGQFLPKRDQHDYCVSHAMTNEKMTELFNQFDLSFIVNQTETPFVLATRGLYDFTINKTICMISPLNPYCGLFFIEKGKTIHSQGNSEKEIMFIPSEFDDVVMKINSFALARQMSDGIGPEIVNEALKVLDKVAELFGHTFNYTDVYMGGCAIDKFGNPLPEEELKKCVESDSVLLGAVGGDKWNDVEGFMRPEKGLLRLRAGMGVYSNNRPAKIWPQLADASPLKKSIVEKGIDFIIVRELIGGIYFGEHKTKDNIATDVLTYSEAEIERIGRIGFETALKRNRKLCSVEKSNVLDSSRLWKKVMHKLASEYPDVELTDMLVDNCAMQIVKNPSQFDVIVTENMFGDILSDEASQITGSIGMIPSSSLGATTCGLYEPIHGSAPDIAGKDIANPVGTILSAAMMLRYSFDMKEEADAIEKAVSDYLDKGYRTADVMSEGMIKVGCSKCGDLIAENLKKE